MACRYMSATSSSEFLSSVAADFDYDVTPVALDVRVRLPPEYTFRRIYG
jgi:hypothetical protein